MRFPTVYCNYMSISHRCQDVVTYFRKFISVTWRGTYAPLWGILQRDKVSVDMKCVDDSKRRTSSTLTAATHIFQVNFGFLLYTSIAR